jgi:antitoxin (DNA-binding transcriptional repressor) of toxin-antitoxin stability system
MARSSSITATIFEAKTHLSELVKQAQAGKTVIITSGREKKPVAKIEAIKPAKKKGRLGFMETPGLKIPDSFWEPLPEEELALWNGEGETYPESE